VTPYRQSPMLFNIVADMLAIMIERAKNDGLIEGVIPHPVDEDYLFFNMPKTRFFLWSMTLRKHRI
jgi:hypothetical protein